MGSRGVAAVLALAVLGAGCLGGCDGGSAGSRGSTAGATPGLSPAPTPSAGSTAPGTATATGTVTAGPFDCQAVSAAQQALNDATAAELTRLGIHRDDARAFSVVLLVASQQAAEYWHAVEAAATPALPDTARQGLSAVTGYWDSLDPRLDAISIGDAGEPSVRAAASELSAVTGERGGDQPALEQQHLQDLLSGSCGVEPAPAPSTVP